MHSHPSTFSCAKKIKFEVIYLYEKFQRSAHVGHHLPEEKEKQKATSNSAKATKLNRVLRVR